MKRLAAVALATLGISAVPVRADVPSVREMVDELAADELGGRGAGSEGLEEARALVGEWFAAAGLQPGLPGDRWFQGFDGAHGETLANVVGHIPGAGPGWIVVGAHYDGLGLGEPGSEHGGQVHPGADDNASGVAALVRIGAALSGGTDYARDVYVVAFSGEETGKLGSEYFVAHPPRDLASLAAMLNLDTVGRVVNNRLIVFGSATADEFPSMLNGVNHIFRFDLALNSEGAGASDHTAFFAKGVPVLHFFSGAKKEYHRPGDRAELVDAAQTERVADFVTEVASYLAGTAEPLTFRPVGAEHMEAPTRPTQKRRVSFGSIPDFSRESGGILLSGVMPGGGAEAAGLRMGDVIVEIDGGTIDNIYDFQGVLSEHAPGDTLHVRYIRAGETRDAKVVLGERH